MPRKNFALFVFANLCAGGLYGQVVITNKPASIRASTYYNFMAKLNGANVGNGITWSVNGIAGGSSALGTFSAFRYNAPTFPPNPSVITISATSIADPTLSDTVTVTILNPVPTLASVAPWPLTIGASKPMVNGSGFVAGAGVTMNGVALPTTYISPTRLIVAMNLSDAPTGDTTFVVVNPDPGSAASAPLLVPPAPASGPSQVSDSEAVRFLEQAAFGADTYSLNRVKLLGYSSWIDEQVNEARSTYPDPANIPFSMGPVQARFFSNAVHGRDQLRQRIALALHKILVVSAVQENDPAQMVPYLQLLSDVAFDNYRIILRKITLNPSMGAYLNMVNNLKANPAANALPNENYARELNQLFSIGLDQLNQDGTYILDASGNPIPTFTGATIREFARVFTGWTYPTKLGATPQRLNPAYYIGDMVYWEPSHDEGAKTLLNGVVDAAGKNADADLNFALDTVFNHPNVGPFVSANLIKQLVTSNPSPDYIARIAAVFANDGLGVRGNMTAVIKAILLDPEARQGDNPFVQLSSGGGALKEPVLFLAQTLRGLSAQVNDSNPLAGAANALGQNIFFPPSVFSYFSPFYELQGKGGLLGPEFQLDTTSTTITRANDINTLIYGNFGPGATLDLSTWANMAGTASTLADAIGFVFLDGNQPGPFRTAVLSAITGTTGTALDKAKAGLYVALTSGYYAVRK